jgi:hypothetical protein
MTWGVSASHVPVLVALAEHYEPRKVLEIGSGELSTPLFLNKKIFPSLISLVSVEENQEWVEKVSKVTENDSRLTFKPTVPASLYDYDLIFIDGPQDSEKRAKTIRFVMREVIAAMIVIHDTENTGYRKAINKVFYSYMFNYVAPYTTVCSKDSIPTIKFRRLNNLMRRKFSEIQEDALAWKPLLR